MVKRILKALLLISFWMAITSASCQKRYNLGIPRIPYTGNELRIDGYYYSPSVIIENLGHYREMAFYDIIIFYRNGLLMNTSMDIDEGADSIKTIENRLRSLPSEWMLGTSDGFGTFSIHNQTLRMSQWSKEWDLLALECEGKIINDSTFTTIYYSKSESKKNYLNVRTYHFKQYRPKPDSTCVFIE